MLTVVIETLNHEEALARTLASLVSAAVDGSVRDVIVLDRGSVDGTRTVADHSGCTFLAGGELVDAFQQARGEWLLLLEPGARLVDGWTEDVRRHVLNRGVPAGFTTNRRRFALRGLFQRTGLGEGLVLSRQQAVTLAGGHSTLSGLGRSVRTQRLDACIIPAS